MEVANVKISNEASLKKFEQFYNHIFLSEFSDPKICEALNITLIF